MSSFLFQNKPNQSTAPNTQTSLFGQGGLFGNQQSSSSSSGVGIGMGMSSQLFPSSSSTNTNTNTSSILQTQTQTQPQTQNSSSLFPNSQSSLINQFQQKPQQPQQQLGGVGTGTQFGTIQMTQPQTVYDNKNLFNIFSNYKDPNQSNDQFRMYFIKEIENIINNFILSIELRSPYNLFKHIFYNRIPFNKDNLNNIDYIYHFQVYNQIIKGEDGNDTYYDKQLHSKGMEKNPNNKKYYAIPICSPNQLSLRNKTNLIIQLSTIKNIYDLKHQYNQLNTRYNKEIHEEISSIYIKKNKIKEKLIRILVKSEKVALLLKRAEVNHYKENKIKESLVNISSVLAKERIVERIQILKRNFENNVYLRSSSLDSTSNNSNFIENFNEEGLKKKSDYYNKCISSLKKMSFDLQKSLIDSQSEIIFMSKELDLIQKYEKNRIYK